MRAVARSELPSTSEAMTWHRFVSDNTFMRHIVLKRFSIVKENRKGAKTLAKSPLRGGGISPSN